MAYKLNHKVWNYYETYNDKTYIYCWNRAQQRTYVTIIDTDDFDKVKNYFWHINSNGYAINQNHHLGKKSRTLFLHRFIMNLSDEDYDNGRIVDHIDRDRLNNCKENLRIVTAKENSRNKNTNDKRRSSTGFVGVSYEYNNRKKAFNKNKFRVRINANGEEYREERFDNFEDAVKRRLELEKEFGYIRKFND